MDDRLVRRKKDQPDTEVRVGDTACGCVVGGLEFTVIGGPCSIESYEQMLQTAVAVRDSGAHALRGGAHKPRSSPYSFQGLGLEGLKILSRVRENVLLPTFTEVLEVADIEGVREHADVFQVGARNMQNYRLLSALGKESKPVLLKRGMSATVEDLLNSAEYVLAEGNENVILCLRGIRTFETSTRNTLDLNAVPVLKERTHLPVIVDPSHGTGKWELVVPMALAAAAAGADGVIVECHVDPSKAMSDKRQALTPGMFLDLVERLKLVVAAVGRKL